MNHDDPNYQQLPDYRRAMFWNIPIGGGRFLPIVRPYGYSWIFAALPEIALNKMLRDDPKAFKEIKSSFMANFQVPFVPTAAKPVVDIYANKSWTKAPIEGQGDALLPSYERRNDKTSSVSNWIGDVFKNKEGLSPKQIDYLVKSFTGSVGDFFWRLPDTIKQGVSDPTDLTNYPVIKKYITDSAYVSATVNDLYDNGAELAMRLKTKALNHIPDSMPVAQQVAIFDGLTAAKSEYNSLAKSFSDARKVITEINSNPKYSAANKSVRERGIHIKMNAMANEFNKKYEKFKKTAKIN